MTPPAPRARIAPLDLLFVRPVPVARPARSRRGSVALVGLATAAAAAVRVATLGAQSFSPSETAYVLGARADAWSVHGALLRGLSSVFGATDAVMRAPSAIAGIAAVPVLYALARRFASREVALGCAAVLAVAPLHVAASQDARPFALALLLGLASLHAVLGAVGRGSVGRATARVGDLWRSRRTVVIAACALLVPVAAAALAAVAWHPSKPDWRGAAAAVESRVRAEDLLLFDGVAAETAYLRYALRADDRLRLDAASQDRVAAALSGRSRAWLVLSDASAERSLRGSALRAWREVDRVYARGVQAVLLERAAIDFERREADRAERGAAGAAQAAARPGRT
ncbi:MAG TPA: glycosyltransferase family 39 protein [Anaeromyxobacteraceae bacterium]|nr:glycosyltransferase family 39 protein [Anaeromyxobacteraceae bacterium]